MTLTTYIDRSPKSRFKGIPRWFKSRIMCTRDLPGMDPRPRKISESRYARCILIYSVHSSDFVFFLAVRSQATVVHRRASYTRLSGWANKVSYFGYGGGRCREHNGTTLYSLLSAPSLFIPFPLLWPTLSLSTRLLRKLTILFREQVERRLYESGRVSILA